MKRSTRWILFFLVLSFVLFMTLGLALGVYFFSRTSPIRTGHRVLVFNVPMTISELPLAPGLSGLFRPRPLTLFETTQAIREAARDESISSILMSISPLGLGWAQVQELRDALREFQGSGKPVYAYLDAATNREYYLSCLADEISIPPETIVQLGLLSETTFYRRTLEKVKVEPQLEHVGKYKSASDILMRDSMTEEHRESVNSLLDSIYGQMVAAIAEGRGIDAASVEAAIDRGLLSPAQMLEAGLVDAIAYPDEIRGKLNIEGEDSESRRISLDDYAQRGSLGLHFGKKIGVVFAAGEIGSGRSANDSWASVIGSDTLSAQLRKMREDESIAAVVLRIDSPGGSGYASDLIWREVELTREEKPVVVSLGDLGASGGYYIVMGADSIFVQPATLTGSIGVIAGKFVLDDLYEWAGMTVEAIKRGENSDIFTSSRGFSEGQREMLLQHIDEFYHSFVDKAAQGREMTWDEIHALAQGRVWTGEQAVAFGLADELGGLKEAIDKAKELAGMDPDTEVPLTIFPRELTFFEQLEGVEQIRTASVELPSPVEAWVKEADRAERYQKEPFLLMMPFVPEIR